MGRDNMKLSGKCLSICYHVLAKLIHMGFILHNSAVRFLYQQQLYFHAFFGDWYGRNDTNYSLAPGKDG